MSLPSVAGGTSAPGTPEEQAAKHMAGESHGEDQSASTNSNDSVAIRRNGKLEVLVCFLAVFTAFCFDLTSLLLAKPAIFVTIFEYLTCSRSLRCWKLLWWKHCAVYMIPLIYITI